MKPIKILVNNSAPERLDKFLASQLESEFHLSRVVLQKIIKSGQVKVNDVIILSSKTLLTTGDQIEVDLQQTLAPTPTLIAQKLDIPVIYQDDDLLIINKPNNLVVHPGAGHETKTLVNGLLAMNINLSQLEGKRPGIVHRLDKQTTGLLIVAKNNLVHQKLNAIFNNHEIEKEYIALVEGVIEEESGKIEMPIGRNIHHRQKMAVVSQKGKNSITHFEVIERFHHATLLRIKLETGRTHQIRVHFSHINHPIYNDPTYNVNTKNDNFGQYLHAAKLKFNHPITHKLMEFQAPLPNEFQDKLKELKTNKNE